LIPSKCAPSSVGWNTDYTEPTPIYAAIQSDGTLKVAWTDSTLTGHVSTFNSDDTFGSDIPLAAGVTEVRGFAALDDGSFAVIVWDEPELFIQYFSSSGSMMWSSMLESNRATDWSLGDGRLIFNTNAQRFEAYYKVHSTNLACTGIPAGHEGDSLKYISTSGAVTTIWCWGAGIGGCSHSMAILESYNPSLNGSVYACVTDCFPGSPSSESYTIGGIYVDGTLVHNAIGGCDGTYGGELGGIVATNTGWLLTFNVPNANIQKDQSTLNGDNYDVGMTTITGSFNAYAVTPPVWLTSTSINEIWSSIARYGTTTGTSAQYLLGYVAEVQSGSTFQRHFYIALINAQGSYQGAVEDITTTAGWGERNGFVTAPNGDVVWVYPYTYTASAAGQYTPPASNPTITVFRLKSGGKANPSSSPASRISSWLWDNLLG